MKRRLMLTAAAGLAVLAAHSGCLSAGKRAARGPGNPHADDIAALKSRGEPSLSPQETAATCLATARELDKANHPEPAIALYEKARQHDAKLTAQVCRRLAVLYDKKGDFTKAMEEYTRALQQSPKDADLLNNMGYSHYCRGEYEPAETFYRKALAVNERNPRVWNNLGLLLGMVGKPEESRAAFEKAVSPAQAHCNVAFLLAARGQPDEAKTYYQKALMLEPSLKIAQDALAKLSAPKADLVPAGGTVQNLPGATPAASLSTAVVAPVQP